MSSFIDSNSSGFIAETSPVVLSHNIGVQRNPPRKIKDRQEDYLDGFDSHTIFYDIYDMDDQVVFSGPPLRNLLSVLDVARIQISGNLLRSRPVFKDAWKTQRSEVTVGSLSRSHAPDHLFSLDAGWLQSSGKIQRNESEYFRDKKVIFTLSKNNDLNWIHDWAEFYVKTHGVDSVLFYDNNSSIYSHQEILDTLIGVDGITSAVVVPWNFPYGPGPGPSNIWDSNYCQYSMLEHARRRFLRFAAGVINVDIDELVLSSGGESVFDFLFEEPSGAIRFKGQWIETVGGSADRLPKFSDFVYKNNNREASLEKWAAVPSKVPFKYQWQVHGFGGGFEAPTIADLTHRHFRGINSNWKYDRTSIVPFDGSVHIVDEDLSGSFKKIDW